MSGRDITYTKEQMQAIRARLLATETERDALREVLKAAYMIAQDGDHPNDHGPVYRDYLSRLVLHLRAALASLDGAE